MLLDSAHRYVLCVGSLGDYRQEFLRCLLAESFPSITVISGTEPIDPSVRIIENADGLISVKNHFLFNRRLTFQTEGFSICFAAERLIVDLNPRSISVWLLLILRRILGRKTAVWGHAWPRTGKHSKTDVLRGMMRRLARNVFVYTQSQATELSEIQPNLSISAAPNAIYSREQMQPNTSTPDAPKNLIYVGRLVKEKKPALLLRAFKVAYPNLPRSTTLIVVGAGPLLDSLKREAEVLKISEHVLFLGHISDHQTLQRLYSTSLASISPGYVGLSITQSFGFGVPMIISKDEPHSPEIECALPDANCMFFTTDSATDLAKKMIELTAHRSYWYSKRNEISEACRNAYCAESMAGSIHSFFK